MSLHINTKSNLASFETDWKPTDYLKDFYTELQPDEVQTINFFVKVLRGTAIKNVPILFFGVGPALHHVFLAAPHASELHLSDYLNSNLDEIEKWRKRGTEKHNWKPFVMYTLKCEGEKATERAVSIREEEARRKIVKLVQADAGVTDPLGIKYRGYYPIVFSPYCADSATSDKQVWKRYMRNITSLVKPGGIFITSALRKCKSYKVGDKYFPSANIDEEDMRRVLSLDFSNVNIIVEKRSLFGHEKQGYSSILLAYAFK